LLFSCKIEEEIAVSMEGGIGEEKKIPTIDLTTRQGKTPVDVELVHPEGVEPPTARSEV
jgi:hypothetical protein